MEGDISESSARDFLSFRERPLGVPRWLPRPLPLPRGLGDLLWGFAGSSGANAQLGRSGVCAGPILTAVRVCDRGGVGKVGEGIGGVGHFEGHAED